MKTSRIIFCATLLAIMACGATNALAHDDATTTTTVTGVPGTISSLNYDENGTIDGFLLGTNILLSFPTDVCGGIGTLGVVGNTVTYSGRATTNSTTGFQTVRVTSFTNGSITYTSTTSHPTPTPYGPAAGTVGQLNYDSDGNIDGFLFGGVLVVTGEPSATLKPLLVVGAAVSVTGTSETSSACVTAPPVTVVEASSLTFGSTTLVVHGHH
jgi:hypothetical protein